MITDEQKIKFYDYLADLFEAYIDEDADQDLTPLEFDDEDDKGNTVRRYFPTTFRYRQECSIENLAMAAEDLTPFAFELIEFLGNTVYGFSTRENNQFMHAVKGQ